MRMAQSEGKSIGGVLRHRRVGEVKKILNHLLHLLFAGASLADHGFLGLFRSIFMDGDPPLRCSEKRHGLRHAKLHGALSVLVDELHLDGKGVRPVAVEELLERLKESEVALGQGEICRGPNAAEIQGAVGHSVGFNEAVSRDRGAGINP